MASAAFRMTSGHDFVAGAVLLKHASIFVEVSHKMLILERRSFSFRGSLAQNARFGSPDLQFSRKSRTKRSFRSSGSSVFEEVSHKTLVLEVRSFSFRGSLAQNARFGSPELQFSRKSRTKRSFWKSGSSVFEEVSHKTLVLELRIFNFRGSLAEFARLQYLHASGPKVDPNTDPETEILQKWSYRILIEVIQDPDTEILHKCPHNRDLVQVLLQDPDTSGPKNPHTEILRQILHKLSSRILIQWSNRIPIQRSCTSGRTGS